MATMWIGVEGDDFAPGQTGFLVETSHATKGWTRYQLRDWPAKTNQSFEPRLHGWCGSHNDVSTNGRGVARAERVAKNGRALVKILEGAEAIAALEDLGFPELAEQLVPGVSA